MIFKWNSLNEVVEERTSEVTKIKHTIQTHAQKKVQNMATGLDVVTELTQLPDEVPQLSNTQ